MKKNTYRKKDKLKSRKQVVSLFTEGQCLYKYPLKVFYRLEGGSQTNGIMQTGVGVSKKYFKSAVQRNYIKRLMREAYRHNSYLLRNELGKGLNIYLFFLYTSKEIVQLALLEERIQYLLSHIKRQIFGMDSFRNEIAKEILKNTADKKQEADSED